MARSLRVGTDIGNEAAKASQHIQERNENVSKLIDAAKRMQSQRMRRILADMAKQDYEAAMLGSSSSKVALGLGPGAALDARSKGEKAEGVNGRDDKGRTALHFTSGMASPECTLILLEAGADPNARDRDGFTPLHMAAGYGRSQCIELLLKHGANAFIKDKAGRSPRGLAVEIKDGSMRNHDGPSVPRGDMDATIAQLANAEWKEHVAVKERHMSSLGGEQCSPAAPVSRPPFEEVITAAAVGNIPGVEAALGKIPKTGDVAWRVSKDAALGNALSAACRGGHQEIAKTLLKSGAPVDAHDSDGATPLLAAADSGFPECLRLLLDSGADANAKDRVGVTALIAAAYNGHAECVGLLLTESAAVDARSHGGVTPLIAAAEGRHASCVKLLLQAGAEVDARTTSEGKTSLMHAVARNAVNATEELLGGGADPNASDADGCTALHHGARHDAADCLRLLCERGADVTRRCKRGRTALQEAPKDGGAVAFLEEQWKALEAVVARRQEELLVLFDEEEEKKKGGSASAASGVVPQPKSSSQKAKDKKRRIKAKKEAAGLKEAAAAQPQQKGDSHLEPEDPVSVLSSYGMSSSSSELDLHTPSVMSWELSGVVDIDVDSEDIFEIMAAEDSRRKMELERSQVAAPVKPVSASAAAAAAAAVRSYKEMVGGGHAPPRKYDSLSLSAELLVSGASDADEWVKVDSKSEQRSTAQKTGDTHARRRKVDATQITGADGGKKKTSTGNKQPKAAVAATATVKAASTVRSSIPAAATGGGGAKQKKSDASEFSSASCDTSGSGDLGMVEVAAREFCQSSGGGSDEGVLTPPFEPSQRALGSPPRGKESTLQKLTAAERLRLYSVEESLKEATSEKERLALKVQELEAAMAREAQRATAEQRRLQEAEREHARERERAEKAASDMREMQEAMAAQEVARMVVERERSQLEARVLELQLMAEALQKSLEQASSSNASLRQQLAEHKDVHLAVLQRQREVSIAAAVAAAAAAVSWQTWELQHPQQVQALRQQQQQQQQHYHSSAHLPSYPHLPLLGSQPVSSLRLGQRAPAPQWNPDAPFGAGGQLQMGLEGLPPVCGFMGVPGGSMLAGGVGDYTWEVAAAAAAAVATTSMFRQKASSSADHLPRTPLSPGSQYCHLNAPLLVDNPPSCAASVRHPSPPSPARINAPCSTGSPVAVASFLQPIAACPPCSASCSPRAAGHVPEGPPASGTLRSQDRLGGAAAPASLLATRHWGFRKTDSAPDFAKLLEASMGGSPRSSGSVEQHNHRSNFVSSPIAASRLQRSKRAAAFYETSHHSPSASLAEHAAQHPRSTLGGMTRSASEGCLSLMDMQTGGGYLPFAQARDHTQSPRSGWFSLVPSPEDEPEPV